MKRTFQLILMFVILFLFVSASADSGLTGDFVFELNKNGTATLVSYTGSDRNVSVPDRDNNIQVTEIGRRAFYNNKDIINVVIPEGVKSIGNMAFGQSNLTGISLPETLETIEPYAFYWAANLKEITFPEGLISVGDYAMAGCTKLLTINIPSSLVDFPNGIFDSLSHLQKITVASENPVYEDIEGVLINKKLGMLCKFPQNKNVSRYTVPDNIAVIGKYAFHNCTKLTGISLSRNITEIAPGAFENCKHLSAIKVNEENAVYEVIGGVLFDKTANMLHTYPAGKTGNHYTVPTGTTSICNYAFSDSKLKKIIIPKSVVEIGDFAFGSSNFTSIVMLAS